ncbi:pseudouridine synthase [Reinekea sp.]|jgi:23S rRNA pseudouridine2457 synthase|uniref:pseudouridine synthase n=1 Tax=Reinekea sp. TaxID=1970455 RepID=UPI002A7F14D9|nr:pseudouridine synthase [Reinekea sp.]
MPRYILFNKPFHVLTQFTDDRGRQTLADYIKIPGIYGAGRLDYDSEGLLLLTDNGALIHRMMNPLFKVKKTYLAQVEGQASPAQLAALRQGVVLNDGPCAACQAEVIDEPVWLWPRTPPIRTRRLIPTSWLALTLTEGRNRQVRRMTAAVGLPTLRLVRSELSNFSVMDLIPGQIQELSEETIIDNGINIKPKKGDLQATDLTKPVAAKRSGRPPQRSRPTRSRSRTVGKTLPGNR